MQLKKSARNQAKIKLGIQGPSGSGKTYSSLLLAYGLCNQWEKIAVIDTENESSHLYSHLGPYKVLAMDPPFTPERYEEALDICVKAGIEVIIIDSISHEWEYLIDYHANLPGNSFANWAKVTPRHGNFLKTLLQAPCHIIATLRTKQEYILSEKNGKMIPEKVGLKSIQRDGIDYEFTLVFELNMKHKAAVSKDRTGLFTGIVDEPVDANTGRKILRWCQETSQVPIDEVRIRINDAKSLQELLSLYREFPNYQKALQPEFEHQKRTMLINQAAQQQINQSKISPNGQQ